MRFCLIGVILLNLHVVFSHPFENFVSQWTPKRSGTSELNEFKNSLVPNNSSGELIPVVIIPCLFGNRLEAMLSGTSPPHEWCERNHDWWNIYVDEDAFYPFEFSCFSYNMGLQLDEPGVYSPPEGVTIKVPGYGFVGNSCEYLDTQHEAPIWHDIVEILKSNFSYVDGVNLRASPYDWRTGRDAWGSSFLELKALIEETYEINGNKSVAALSLSMGCPYFISFLNTMEQDWKDTYIYSFTSFSGVFGGSSWALFPLVTPMLQFASYEFPSVEVLELQNMVRSWGSLSYLSPYPSVFGDEVFFMTPERNYTSSNEDILQLLNDAAQYTSWTTPVNLTAEIFASNVPFRVLYAPGVRMNCVYGTNIPTLSTASLPSNDFSKASSWNNGTGDGTVLDASLSVCQNWISEQEEPIIPYLFPLMVHGGAVTDPRAIKVFLNELGLLN